MLNVGDSFRTASIDSLSQVQQTCWNMACWSPAAGQSHPSQRLQQELLHLFRPAWITLNTRNTKHKYYPTVDTQVKCQWSSRQHVSGLQSGSGKWSLLKPVPKSWAFSPNTKIPQQTGGGLCHGSTRLGLHHLHTTHWQTVIHTRASLGFLWVFAAPCRPAAPHTPEERWRAVHKTRTRQLITADCQLLCSGLKAHHGVCQHDVLYIFCHHSMTPY